MAIEDVQYLLNNSVEDSVQIFVDSNKRDREFYPTPSEYTISFPQPVRNVFGLEIVDATIPSAMYNVDEHTSTLRIILFNVAPALQTTQNATHGAAFGARSVLEEIGDAPRLRGYLDTVAPDSVFIVRQRDYETAVNNGGFVPATAPQSANVILSSKHAFLTRGAVHGLSMFKNVSVTQFERDPAYKVFYVGQDAFAFRRDAPSAQPLLQALATQNAATWMFVVRGAKTYPTTAAQALDVIWFRIIETDATSLQTYLNAGYRFEYEVSYTDVRLPLGNYNLNQFQQQLSNTLKQPSPSLTRSSLNISVGRANQLPTEQTYKFKYESNYQFFFDMEHSGLRTAMGFDEYARTVINPHAPSFVRLQTLNNSLFLPYGDNYRVFASSLDPSTDLWTLGTPGIITLLGERYVKLRCPEIEDYLNGTALYTKFGTGLGIFKLAGRNEVTNIRFDFVKVKNRDIHPIGKLSRLTFRFEKSDGDLYDFKGVNHNMLINIKTWVPQKKMQYEGSLLNEEYNPDIMAYMNGRYVDPYAVEDTPNNDVYYDVDKHHGPKVNDLPYDYSTDGSTEESSAEDEEELSPAMAQYQDAVKSARNIMS